MATDQAAVLDRLRTETRAEHLAIEETLGLGLVSDELTIEHYRSRLERLYGFYRPVEERLTGVLERAIIDLGPRSKVPLLRADLETLGTRPIATLPLCVALPPLGDSAECFGCLYVLEGSTLGGQVITRHVRARLGVTPEHGARFFAGYGATTAAMWTSFRTSLVDFATSSDRQDGIVAAAVSTFRALRSWCAR